MNREIKFRIWNKDEFVNPDDFNIRLDGSIYSTWGKEHQLDLENWTIQQYTGLKDKNGREIYEGDIIKQHHGYIDMEKQDWVGAVYFGSYCYKGNDMYETGWFMKTNFQNLGFKIHKDCEIIGNILENQGML